MYPDPTYVSFPPVLSGAPWCGPTTERQSRVHDDAGHLPAKGEGSKNHPHNTQLEPTHADDANRNLISLDQLQHKRQNLEMRKQETEEAVTTDVEESWKGDLVVQAQFQAGLGLKQLGIDFLGIRQILVFVKEGLRLLHNVLTLLLPRHHFPHTHTQRKKNHTRHHQLRNTTPTCPVMESHKPPRQTPEEEGDEAQLATSRNAR